MSNACSSPRWAATSTWGNDGPIMTPATPWRCMKRDRPYQLVGLPMEASLPSWRARTLRPSRERLAGANKATPRRRFDAPPLVPDRTVAVGNDHVSLPQSGPTATLWPGSNKGELRCARSHPEATVTTLPRGWCCRGYRGDPCTLRIRHVQYCDGGWPPILERRRWPPQAWAGILLLWMGSAVTWLVEGVGRDDQQRHPLMRFQ
jgi:hypothetical protein